MQTFLNFWPVLVFILGLWFGGLGLAVGLTMWIMGQLARQDGSRIELKEILLKEIRATSDGLRSHMDRQHDQMWSKINDLGNRLTRVETKLKVNEHIS
jgi:hypothetical protein